jgi:hypothetical protein
MKVQHALVNMTGGEVSPRLDGRPDVAKQRNGLRAVENMQIVVHGGARKRSGTQFVAELPADEHVLWPFQYSTEDSYMLLFGPGYIWIAKDRGLVTQAAVTITGVTKASPGVVTAAAHGLENGDKVLLRSIGGMVELNNRIVTVANKTTNTFELSGINTTSYTTYTSGGTVNELIIVSTTYAADELQELSVAQYNDVMYITHKNHPIRKLSRVSNTSWTLTTVEFTTGPFRQINGDDEKVMTITVRSIGVTGATRANPCVITTNGAHAFSVGATVSFSGVGGMVQLNGNAYDVTAVTSNTLTISVNSSAFTAYTSGGTISFAQTIWSTLEKGASVELATSWSEFSADHVGALYRLQEAGNGTGINGPTFGDNTDNTLQNGLVYTSGGYIYGISNRTGRNDWKNINRVPEHTTGVVRVIGTKGATDTSFDANFLHPGYCIVQITAVNSATSAYATIVRYQMPQSVLSQGTSFWEEGAWSDYRGYPRCCAFFEQRLWAAGSDSEPTVVWASRSSRFENFEDGEEDDHAIVYRAASGLADVIRWLSGGRVLTAGTSQGEYAIAASNQNEALTPSNLRMLLQTTYGASDCPPVRVNEAVLYPQRNGSPANASRKLREFSYDFTADVFNSVDLTVFAEHVTGSGINRMGYTMQPDPMIWATRVDGQMAVCTYERLQEVIAWQRHRLGGTDAVAKVVAVCPGASGDDVWIEAERTVNGGTVRTLEVFRPPYESVLHDKEDAVLLDSSLTYEGASTSTITGLWHLRGEDVKILNNGNVEEGTVSATGSLTLARATTKAHIGYGYTGILETEDLEAGAQAGTAQSRNKRISQVYVRVLDSLGGTIGQPGDSGDLEPIKYRTPADPMGSTPPLYSGLIECDFKGDHDREAQIRIEHDDPLPLFITAIIAEISTVG